MTIYEQQQARKAAEVRYATWDAETLRKQNPPASKPGEVTVRK
jgi:hypothetical protein